MNGAALESLLRTQNVQLTRIEGGRAVAAYREERLLWDDPTGPLRICAVTDGSETHHLLRHADEIAVEVRPNEELIVSFEPGVPRSTVDHFLADQVFPRVLSEKVELVLHAGAICREQGAVLLIGSSGSGKSTLATSFHQSGWALMGDDAVIVETRASGPAARAVYPSLRLFPDSIEALFTQSVAAEAMAHYSSKQRIALPLECHSENQVPINAAFLLAEADADAIAIRRLSIAETCIAFVGNAFALDPSDPEQAACRLARAGRLAASIPAFSLAYPRDYRRLAEVRDAVERQIADLRALPA